MALPFSPNSTSSHPPSPVQSPVGGYQQWHNQQQLPHQSPYTALGLLPQEDRSSRFDDVLSHEKDVLSHDTQRNLANNITTLASAAIAQLAELKTHKSPHARLPESVRTAQLESPDTTSSKKYVVIIFLDSSLFFFPTAVD